MNSKQLNEFEQLIKEFSRLPKPNLSPTFMDICHMGGDRFEERCSQILRFYFDPNGIHKLRDLFLKSFLEALGKDNCTYRNETTYSITEEVTPDQKRIDITVITDDFVIAIENKILASLYNPLESYYKYIEDKYKSKEKIYVVLSIKQISDLSERKKMRQNSYCNITYSDFFTALKNNIGNYIEYCDKTYLTFLLDFIRTIEKNYYNTTMDEMNKFFFNHKDSVEDLLKHYQAYKDGIVAKQINEISTIRSLVSERTNANWWVYQGWDLGIAFNEGTDRKIGIECNFKMDNTKGEPLGIFQTFITVWDAKCFIPFENELIKAFPNCFIDKESNGGKRVYLHLPAIEGNDTDKIVSSLSEYYNVLKNISQIE